MHADHAVAMLLAPWPLSHSVRMVKTAIWTSVPLPTGSQGKAVAARPYCVRPRSTLCSERRLRA